MPAGPWGQGLDGLSSTAVQGEIDCAKTLRRLNLDIRIHHRQQLHDELATKRRMSAHSDALKDTCKSRCVIKQMSQAPESIHQKARMASDLSCRKTLRSSSKSFRRPDQSSTSGAHVKIMASTAGQWVQGNHFTVVLL